MNRKELQLAAQCLTIGFVAGLRSATAPATLTAILSEQTPQQPLPESLDFLQTPKARGIALQMAVGEMLFEKLPFIPARTDQPGLTIRCSSGAFCGAVLAHTRSGSPIIGGLLGFIGAVIGSYGGYAARTWLSENLKISSALLGLPEDLITAALALTLTTTA